MPSSMLGNINICSVTTVRHPCVYSLTCLLSNSIKWLVLEIIYKEKNEAWGDGAIFNVTQLKFGKLDLNHGGYISPPYYIMPCNWSLEYQFNSFLNLYHFCSLIQWPLSQSPSPASILLSIKPALLKQKSLLTQIFSTQNTTEVSKV